MEKHEKQPKIRMTLTFDVKIFFLSHEYFMSQCWAFLLGVVHRAHLHHVEFWWFFFHPTDPTFRCDIDEIKSQRDSPRPHSPKSTNFGTLMESFFRDFHNLIPSQVTAH